MKELIKNLLSKIAPSFYLKIKVKRFIKNGGLKKSVWGGGILELEIQKAVERVLPKANNNPKLYQEFIEYLVGVYLSIGVTPEEFCVYRLEPFISHKEVAKYLPSKDQDITLMSKYNWEKAFIEAEDKIAFYNIVKPFFKREVCAIYGLEDKACFKDFCEKHKNFIFKPNCSFSGVGIRVIREEEITNLGASSLFDNLFVTTSGKEVDENSLYLKLLNGARSPMFILEELIQQSSWMSQWNKSSVNTVRISSIRTKDGIFNIMPVFFFGRSGVEVSNGHFGGFAVAIDKQTGVLLTDALSINDGETRSTKPNTNAPIKGEVIPQWREALELVEKAHQSLPKHHHFMGWDLAHTDNGWVVVEGNWSGSLSISQAVFGQGCRAEYEELMNKI